MSKEGNLIIKSEYKYDENSEKRKSAIRDYLILKLNNEKEIDLNEVLKETTS